jgi:hypothetical protein
MQTVNATAEVAILEIMCPLLVVRVCSKTCR